MSSQADLTHDEVKRILELVDQSGDVELLVEYDDFKLHIRKGNSGNGASSMLNPSTATQASAPQSVAVPADSSATPVDKIVAEEKVEAAPVGEGASTSTPLAEGALTIVAPMLSRFYRASSPSNPPFVEIGGKVSEGDTVAVIEVMKLFNEIKSNVSGTVTEIRVANGEMVEEGDVLFVIQPD